MMHRAAAILAAALASLFAEDGFIPLFDGKTLDGWVQVGGANGPHYIVEEGAIVCLPQKGNSGRLFYDREFSDFTLRFDLKLVENANNGVAIRTPKTGHVASAGMEIQIIETSKRTAPLRPEQHHMSVYDLIPARQGFMKPPGEWNAHEIHAEGRRLKITVNGAIVMDVDLGIVREPEVLKKHPGVLRPSGYIGWVGHNSRVEFRNVRLKPLK